MTTIQALVMAILQGITELFPVSSLGHAVILPALLHWNLDERGLTFLPFLVMLHVGTAAALLAFFWRDWLALAVGAVGAADPIRTLESRYILGLIVVATIPAVVIGFLLEHLLRTLFGTPLLAAGFLAINGVILLVADWLRARLPDSADRPIASLSITDALVVGCWQCLAFLPGISRAGATMTGGLLRGVSHQTAARFSFLIALPIILAATAQQTLRLHQAHISLSALQPALIGAVAAGITAFLSTAFLMRYFREHEAWALRPFALYSLVAGLGSIIALSVL
jgi:undecaprenyl-diphosphatase